MSGYFIDPKIVHAFLQKPYDLCEVWQRVAGTPVPAQMTQPRFYSDDEIALIHQEKDRLYADLSAGRKVMTRGRKHFTLSAGASGAGKSTLLEDKIINDPDLRHAVFSDPDERALKLMPVYHDDIRNYGGGQLGLALSYTKWRWASNYISNSIMNRACEDGHDILLGTTAMGASVGILYDNARRQGYESTTIIIAAPDNVRHESSQRRFEEEQTRYTTDAVTKGLAFYERLPLYFEKSESFSLYWRKQSDRNAVLAASGKEGRVVIHDRVALNEFISDCGQKNPDLSWDHLVKTYKPHP